MCHCAFLAQPKVNRDHWAASTAVDSTHLARGCLRLRLHLLLSGGHLSHSLLGLRRRE